MGAGDPFGVQPGTGLRVGLFGLLGAGNIGNDGSLEAVLRYVREHHPDARVELMCGGDTAATDRFGVPSTRMHGSDAEYRSATRLRAVARKAWWKVIDAIRTVRWVRRFDVVMVPGMGVLEATLPLRPWGFPYSLFVLCAGARIVGTRTALVGVGADPITEAPIRWLVVRSARLATYRSYRDEHSREAMRGMGVDTSADQVYPDLAFGLPVPPVAPAGSGAVGVGVMDYRGRNADRGRAAEVHRRYLDAVLALIRRLLDDGRSVRLFTGDRSDEAVVAVILDDLRRSHPHLDPGRVTAEPAADLGELMRRMAEVDIVVATRYHNVLSAVRLGKPTVSLGYAAKHEALMTMMGLGDFCLSAREIDPDRLVCLVSELQAQAPELRRRLAERNRIAGERIAEQFAALTTGVLAVEPAPVVGAASMRSGR